MSVDTIVASLPTLVLDAPAPLTWAKFCEMVGGGAAADALLAQPFWVDLETQLRNAQAEARKGDAKYQRPVTGCSLYWKNRVLACFQETDVLARENLLDRVWWDAAGEMTKPESPLGAGALATYAVRLKLILRRSAISTEAGRAAFERLTAETKI